MNEEDIIALQKKTMQEQFGSIHSPVTYIAGKRYHFEEQEIHIGNVLIHLPQEFIDLPPAIAKLKYPAENRPKIIKSSPDTSINFAFTTIPQPIKEDDLVIFGDTSLDALKKVSPQNTYLERGLGYYGPERNKLYNWYEYYGPTLDEDSYSFHAFLREGGRLLLFLFNCPKNIYENWRLAVFETVMSVREKPMDWNLERGRQR